MAGNFQDFSELGKVEHCQLISARLVDKDGLMIGQSIDQSDECFVQIEYNILGTIDIYPYIALYNSMDELVWTDRLSRKLYNDMSLYNGGIRSCSVRLPFHILLPSEYNLEIGLGTPSGGQFLGLDTLTFMKNALSITTISEHDNADFNSGLGIVKYNASWSF